MRVTALGHAGLEVTLKKASLLVDPWLSPEGAFQASWFQYPENAHLARPETFQATAVVISHEHLDHVDTWTLSQIPSRIPVVIPRYPSPALRRKVLAGGHREVIEAAPWDPVEVAENTLVFFVPEESPMNHDAAIVIQGDGYTLLDMNDARLSPMQLRMIRTTVGGRIHLFALQTAGASWYPMCYEYPPERRKELASRKRLAKLGYAARAVRVVDPIVALPFAGPPCFLDPELFPHNAEMDEGIFPDQLQSAAWLRKRGFPNVIVLLPGHLGH
jgi:UDP-MurNAc hydroxylase